MNKINLGYGCVGIATYGSLKNSLRILDRTLELGISYFDTAPIYSRGFSEKVLGLFSENKRDKIEISSKFGLGFASQTLLPISLVIFLNKQKRLIQQSNAKTEVAKTNDHFIDYRRIDKHEIEKSLYLSLKRLRTDYLDRFLLHEACSNFLTDEAMLYLIDLKTKGIVRQIGLACNFYNIKNDSALNFWDVLQYENSPTNVLSDFFISEYPHKQHVYHSCLQEISKQKNKLGDLGGVILAYELKKNPNGKVLFATGNGHHLEHNIITAQKFVKESKENLRKLIINALL